MIKIKLSELLGKSKMTRKALAEMIGARPNTIGDLYHEKVKRVELDMLSRICEALDCEISDLLEYQPDEE
ncbi:MAG: helix-turn-helix transcriptional regulator [Clostridiales bacterium]|nr:helix-turn-helix transcriptional regulator [Clostridiales bacterium]